MAKVDAERDFHGFTAAGMREELDAALASGRWHGLRRVRVIHGKGEVLGIVLREWCEEVGMRWAPEPGNPGATMLYPSISDISPPVQPSRPVPKPRRAARPRKPEIRISPEDTQLFEQTVADLDRDPPAAILRRKRGR